MGKIEKSHKELNFFDQIGQKATVHRETVGQEKASIQNRQLCDLGISMAEVEPKLKGYTYMGSAAVHVYASTILDSVVFVSQTDPLDLYRCPEPVAGKAFDDLQRSMMALYGKRKGKLRSGF